MNQPSVQFSSAAQSCPTLCDPMNLSKLGFPAGVQPWQNPRGTLGMNGVGKRRERRHVRPILIGPTLLGRERERE